MKKHTGVILWEGKSLLTGDPIVAIATFKTSNVKTGPMVQTWILRTDIEPHDAVQRGMDDAICGNCPHKSGRGCYVTVFQAPLAVYRAYKRGAYPMAASLPDVAANKLVRLGSYGDPAAVPFEVWQALTSKAKKHTGYTHQYNHKAFDPRIASLCMVSTETVAQTKKMHALGLRTFRASHDTSVLLPGERRCTADSRGLTCAQCAQCDGGDNKRLSYVVKIHGAKASRFATDSNLIAVA